MYLSGVTLKKFLGEGGALLSKDEGQPWTLYDVLKAITDGFNNRLLTVPCCSAPTTASTQATGTGTLNWRVNLANLVVVVAGVVKEFAAQADFVIHNTATVVASGQSVVAAIIAKNLNGTVSLLVVEGAAATTGAQVAPTDAAINKATANMPWVKLAECTLNRTADTTVTQTCNNAVADIGDQVTPE